MKSKSGFFAVIVALVATITISAAPAAAQTPSDPADVAMASRCAAQAWVRHLPGDGLTVPERRFRELMFAAGGACMGVDVARVTSIACTNSWLVGAACAPPPAAPALPPPERGIHIAGPRPAPRDPCAPPARCEERPQAPPVATPGTPAPAAGVTRSGHRYRVVQRHPAATPPAAAPSAPPARR